MIKHFCVFDDAIANHAVVLTDYVGCSLIKHKDIDALDEVLKEGWNQNKHAAVFMPYGLGYSFNELENDTEDCVFIYWFDKKDAIRNADRVSQVAALKKYLSIEDPNYESGLVNVRLNHDYIEYAEKIKVVKQSIASGEIYQANYTGMISGQAYGEVEQIYFNLRQEQAVPYGVFACLPGLFEEGLQNWFLSFSPELFFDLDNGTLRTEPMKGTMAVPSNANEATIKELSAALAADEKNRAENLMIVDLLRNDLSKIAQPNSVKTEELFKVERFGEVLQMTSKISAKLDKNQTAAKIVKAMFPCGSITGAPKRKSMEILRQLEIGQRGIYTGSIGYFEPAHNEIGFNAKFNVAIRTLVISEDIKQNMKKFNFGVGSGVVFDSTASDEFKEIKLKSNFIRRKPQKFGLIETMRLNDLTIPFLWLHLNRLRSSCIAFNIHFEEQKFIDLIERELGNSQAKVCSRIRVVHYADGSLDLSTGPLENVNPVVGICSNLLPRYDVMRRFKTTQRQVYNDGLAIARQRNWFDCLYLNQDSILLEGARTNVYIRHDGQIYTPSLDLDILPGVARAFILSKPDDFFGEGAVIYEGHIPLDMLREAENIYVSNALYGIFEVDIDYNVT